MQRSDIRVLQTKLAEAGLSWAVHDRPASKPLSEMGSRNVRRTSYTRLNHQSETFTTTTQSCWPWQSSWDRERYSSSRAIAFLSPRCQKRPP